MEVKRYSINRTLTNRVPLTEHWRPPENRISFQNATWEWLSWKQGENLMPVGMFRSEEGWVQVDYGTGNIPIPRSKYEENKYKPDFDKLPSEAAYLASEKKKEDDARA
jgi:hypothetical protein